MCCSKKCIPMKRRPLQIFDRFLGFTKLPQGSAGEVTEKAKK